MNAEQEKIIEGLFLSLYDSLIRYAQSALGNPCFAEEAVQEAFAIACRRPDQVCSSQNPKGWLVEALKLVIRNIESRRRTANRIICDLTGYRPDLVAAPAEDVDLKLLYGNLTRTKEFKLVYAIAVENKSFIEISKELGITVDTCRKRLERARKFLQKKIK